MKTASSSDISQPTEPPPDRQRSLLRWLVFLLVGVLFIGVLMGFSQWDLLDTLVASESAIQDYYETHPFITWLGCFLIYVVVTGLSIPGALLMSLIMAWFLGFWPALLVITLAASTGATIAFLVSRYLLRDWYRAKFSRYLSKFNEELDRNGPFYLFTLRLTPAVPFFVINVVMGLTRIRPWVFWWVSLVGMMPWTAIYVNAGARVPDLATLQKEGAASVLSPERFLALAVAFILIGVFPLVVRWLLTRRGRDQRSTASMDRGQPQESDPSERS